MEVGEDGWIGEVDVVHLMATLGAGDVATTRMVVEEVVSAWIFILYFLDLMYSKVPVKVSQHKGKVGHLLVSLTELMPAFGISHGIYGFIVLSASHMTLTKYSTYLYQLNLYVI
jgi:hypothetical protein